MSVKRQPVAIGGLLSTPKVTFSKGTQELLKEMMKESQLTNFQRRELNGRMKKGESLPVHCSPSSSATKPLLVNAGSKSKPSTQTRRSGIRTYKTIAQLAAEEDDYTPALQTRHYNSSIEKERLQDLMATGKLEKKPVPQRVALNDEQKEEEERERSYDEIVHEISERQQFLEEMESLGQGREYRNRIMAEISQRVRELELIEKEF